MLRNSLILTLRTLLQIVVGFVTSRLVLQALGVDDFGVYSAVAAIVMVGEFAFGSIRATAVRYMAHDQQQLGLNMAALRRLALWATMAFGAIIFGVGLWVTACKLNLPPGMGRQAVAVFVFLMVGYCCRMLTMPYEGALIATERMVRVTVYEAISLALRLAIAFWLLTAPPDRVVWYALLTSAAYMVVYFIYRLTLRSHGTRSLGPDVNRRARQMLRLASTDFVGAAGLAVYRQGTPVIINIFFGVVYSTAVGLGHSLCYAISGLQISLTQAVLPRLYRQYGEGLSQGRLFAMVLTLISLTLGIIVALMCLFMPQLLHFWLGEVPAHTAVMARLMLCAVWAMCPGQIAIAAAYARSCPIRLTTAVGVAMAMVPLATFVAFRWGAPAEYAYCMAVAVGLATSAYCVYGAWRALINKG